MNEEEIKQGLPVILFDRDGETIVKLLCDIEYETDRLGKILVPKDFESDGCSIPRILWRLVGHPFDVKYLNEAILHDFLYKTQPCTQKQADQVFREELKAHGKLSATKRGMIYHGLRIGGWVAWKKHQKENKKEKTNN